MVVQKLWRIAVSVTNLAKEKARCSEHRDCMALCLSAVTELVPGVVAYCHCETREELLPPLLLARVVPERELGLAHCELEDLGAASALALGWLCPLTELVFDKDRRLPRNHLPLLDLDEPYDVVPQVGFDGGRVQQNGAAGARNLVLAAKLPLKHLQQFPCLLLSPREGYGVPDRGRREHETARGGNAALDGTGTTRPLKPAEPNGQYILRSDDVLYDLVDPVPPVLELGRERSQQVI